MIFFKKLKFKNAITYKNLTEVCLEKQGAVYIGGLNGSGKSLIFNVFYNILFGYTPLSSKGKRKLIANDNYYASLDFSINNEDFTIEQYFNQEKGIDRYDILKNNESMQIAGGIPESEKFISNILPFTAEEFSSFYYLSQDSLHVLAYGKGSERLNYLSSVFGFEIFDKVRIRLKTLLDEVDNKLTSAIQAQEISDDIKSNISKYPSVKLLDSRLVLYNKYLTIFNKERDSIDTDIEKINREISVIDNRKTLEENLKSYDSSLPQPESILISLNKGKKLKEIYEKTIRDWRVKEKLLEQFSKYKEYKYNLSDISDRLDKLMIERGNALFNNKEVEKRKKLEYEILSLKKNKLKLPMEEILDKRVVVSKKLIENKAILNRLEKDFNFLNNLKGDGGKCSRCGQPLDAVHVKKEIEHIVVEKKKIIECIKKYSSEEKFINSQSEILNNIKDLTKLLNNINYSGDLVMIKDLDKKINSLKNVIDKVKERKRLDNEISKYSVNKNIFNESSRKLKNTNSILDKLLYNYKQSINRKSLLTQLNNLPDIKYSNHSELLVKYNKRKNLLNISISEIFSDIKEINTIKKIVMEYKVSLDKYSKQISEIDSLQEDRRILNACWKAYAPNKLKKDAVASIASVIADQLNIFVPMIFDEDIYFLTDIKENSVDILFKRGGQPARDVRFLNGGHKKRFLIALIPTLAGMISSEKRSNLIILDEIDANVDISGRESIGEFLIPYLKKKFDTVVVISPSHFSSDSKSLVAPIPLDYFDKVWVAEYKNGSSFLNKNINS